MWIRSVRWLSSQRRSQTQRYLDRQMKDQFTNKAREHSYRARSAFKLMELNDKFKFLEPGKVVLDVGCAPGSWSQVVVEKCKLNEPSSSGLLVGVDLQPILPLRGATFLSLSDITKRETQTQVQEIVSGRELGVVLSDMAPNPTGDPDTDHLRILNLCRTVFHLFHPSDSSTLQLSNQGVYICKIWDGTSRNAFISELSDRFTTVKTVKPTACRDNSAELYLFCKGRK